MTDETNPFWLSIDLDPGTAAFFGLPVHLRVPLREETTFLGTDDTRVSLSDLAPCLEEALARDPDMADRADVMRFVRRWPRYADLDRYLRMGNTTFGETVARGLLEDDPHDPPPLMALGLIAARAGRWSEAAALLARALERAPSHGLSRLHHALCLAGAGDRDGARRQMEGLARRSRVQSLARFWLHEIRADDATDRTGSFLDTLEGISAFGEGGDADAGWNALAEAFPENPEVAFVRAVRSDSAIDDAEREHLLHVALNQDPGHTPAAVALATILRRTGRAQEALDTLDACLRSEPQHPALHAARGQALEHLGRRDEAREAYRAGFEGPLAQVPVSALSIGGQGLLRLETPDAARALLEDCIEARPGDPVPHQLLARLDEAEGKPDASERRLRSAIRVCGPLPSLQHALGDLLRRAGRRVEAEGLFKVLVRRHPGSPWGHRGLGDLEVAEQPARAMEHYAEALKRNPAFPIPGYDYLRGVAALRASDPAAARRWLEQAVAAEPDNARYWCDLGAAYFYAEALDHAVAATEQALAIDPEHPGFLHNLSTYCQLRFRQRPWRIGQAWRAWRLRRAAAATRREGWRRDLWKPADSPGDQAREEPPPA